MSNADALRLIALQIMSAHAAIEPRGFDTIAKRADLHRQWDELYEDYLLELAVEQVSEPA